MMGLLICLVLSLMTSSVFGTSRIWTGASSSLWSDPNNWQLNVPGGAPGIPQDGEDISIGPYDSHLSMTNDLTNLAPSGVFFGFTATDYQLSGNPLILRPPGGSDSLRPSLSVTLEGSGTVTINCPLIFDRHDTAGQVGIIYANAYSGDLTENTAYLHLNGPISIINSSNNNYLRVQAEGDTTVAGGSAHIYVSGQVSGNAYVLATAEVGDDNSVEFDGPDDNTFTGALNIGTEGNSQIVFNKSSGHAVNSSLLVVFGDARLRLDRPDQIGPNATVALVNGTLC